MATVSISVDRFTLEIDASDTVRAVLESGDTDRGAWLRDALRVADGNVGTFAVSPDVPVTREDFRPGVPDREDMPEVSASGVDAVLSNLQRAGLVTMGNVWAETSGEAYLSDGRTLTAVRALRPFQLVQVTYGWSSPRLMGYADRWEISEHTGTVQAGCYLVGLVGDYGSTLVDVTGVDTDDTESLALWAVELEGFGASRCEAGCGACGARWYAESGSWQFTPEHGTDAAGWAFDDADGFDADTITCPACATGHVGFSIF